MMFYAVASIFFTVLFFLLMLRINAAIFYVQVLFWFFGLFGILSVVYLEVFPVYIIEQFRYSSPNGAAICLLILFLFHLFGVLFGQAVLKQKVLALKSFEAEPSVISRLCAGGFLVASIILLVVLYTNLLISSLPPFLGGGYVDRFGYMETTALWAWLSAFGVITVPVPVMLGWLLYVSRVKIFILILEVFYLLYLLLIGQKFGGFVLALFLFFLPVSVSGMIRFGTGAYLGRFILWGGGLGFCALGVVYYHYSQYALSEDFGGPLGLILYRIFGLQGHAFWGGFDFFIADPMSYFDPLALMDGMQGVMRLIAPAIADEMIKRGVSFTFGYFISILLHLGFFAPLALFLFGWLHLVLVFYLVASVIRVSPVRYFLLANILISFNGFISMGSLSYILNFKVLAVCIIFICVLFVSRVSRVGRAVEV
ncbi:DUF6418 domain-containing protein [Pseudomonas alcaligenes]|jgi:hypothetical protein|uniref:DUF6418 domain-containing protein n=1 Tax=Aquipseudomonas alcaligenes TaxID=43263 RepID=UPI002E7B741C|nr:DUF6418 domain-containing protein [Pseudomonas alcaligenes]MEE1949590.1 DUF6418 domain-containing protein [Pseudomonas alcaligenes]